ncbi:MAG: hypothetical protein ACK5N0_09945 [Synechococcaceae cyanobacterium]
MSRSAMRSSHEALKLPRSVFPSPPSRMVFRRRRRSRRLGSRLAQASIGLLLVLMGVGILSGLMQLPRWLDTVLLVSTAIANLISGLSHLGLGLLQLLGVFGVLALAVLALLLLVGGVVRLFRSLTTGQERQRG